MTQSSGSQNVQQQQQSISQPWAPAQPGLQAILSGTAGLNPQETPTEAAAIQQLTSNAGGIPNFGPTAANTAASYLGGDPYGLLSHSYGSIGNSLGPILDPNNLNPFNTPGFAQALNTANQDITNQIQGEFAGAGRTGSGQDTQTLARGLAQGEGGLIQSQFNANRDALQNAAQNYFNAGIGTNQAAGQNTALGGNIAGLVPGLATQGPAALLQAGQAPFNLVAGNLAQQAGITAPIAALGGQVNTNTNTQGQTTQNASPLSAGLGIASLFGGQFSPISNIGGILGRLGSGLQFG